MVKVAELENGWACVAKSVYTTFHLRLGMLAAGHVHCRFKKNRSDYNERPLNCNKR